MFALDNPYVSDFLIETLKKNNYKVLENEIVANKGLHLLGDKDFAYEFSKTRKLYTNSENSIERLLACLDDNEIASKIKLFKDKVEFRKLLSTIYPNFFFKQVSFDELEALNPEDFKYPFVIKPSVGFLSFGVYTVFAKEDLKNVIEKIKISMEKAKGIFPIAVLNSDNFILEQFIEGDEFAIDVYYDENSKPVILNIFKHPFVDKNDVSDRMYVSSLEIISKYFDDFKKLFEKIGKVANLKNFPMHIELRANGDDIIPIEINPLRFAGWCLTDLAYFAYGINVYEYFMENKHPDWKKLFETNKSTYAFVMGEVPLDVDRNKIASFDIDRFKQDMNAEILDTRIYDFRTKPMFCSLFVKANSYSEIEHILKIDIKKYIKEQC